MRDIKFRVWYENEMISLKKAYQLGLISFSSDFELQVPFENVDLLQYVGLSDTAGKKVFEGDIVAADSDKDARTVEVIFKDGCFYGEYKPHQFCEPLYKLFGIWDDMNAKYIVIGNVWEPPELLSHDR